MKKSLLLQAGEDRVLGVLLEGHAADEVGGRKIRGGRLVVQRMGLVEDQHLRAVAGQGRPLRIGGFAGAEGILADDHDLGPRGDLGHRGDLREGDAAGLQAILDRAQRIEHDQVGLGQRGLADRRSGSRTDTGLTSRKTSLPPRVQVRMNSPAVRRETGGTFDRNVELPVFARGQGEGLLLAGNAAAVEPQFPGRLDGVG